MPRANSVREARADAGKFTQNLTGLPEIEMGGEMLDEVKDVAFRIAPRVPPSSALVVDDQDLAFFPPVFKAVRRALPSIKPPWRRQAIQQGGAIYRRAQLLYFWVMRSHRFGSRSGFAGGEKSFVSSSPFPCPEPSTGREAGALQGRASGAAETSGAARRPNPLSARLALAAAI
jgi:hypothetical protein